MFKSTTKKLVAFLLAIGCSAAFAYPPPYYFCNKECIAEGFVKGSPEYKECMTDCLSWWPA
jgi:hypothetical protein|nr:hypothetical protein [uncultured Undibacterium sp.]